MLFDTSTTARENATRQSLSQFRNAVQLYRAQNGALPGAGGTQATLKADLTPYFQGPFPYCEVGNPGNTVRVTTGGGTPIVAGVQSWAYDNVSGEVIVNHASYSSW